MRRIRISEAGRDFLSVMVAVRRSPGLSVRELRDSIKMNSRRARRAVRRLVRAGVAELVTITRDGRHIDFVYRRGRVPPAGAVQTPLRLLAGGGAWGAAYVYALDSSCIGVTGRPCRDWARAAMFRARVPTRATGRTLLFDLPFRFAEFYLLDRSWVTRSVTAGGRILLTVSGMREF